MPSMAAEMETSDPATFPSRASVVADRVLVGLLLIDAVVLVLHLANVSLWANRHAFLDVTRNAGFGEVVGYGKTMIVIGLLLVLWRRTAQLVMLVWAAVFVVLLADDSLRVHETMGRVISRALDFPQFVLFLRGRDYGEMLYLAGLGLVVAVMVALAWRRSSEMARRASVDIALMVGLLALFGVVFDALHEALPRHHALKGTLALADDFGELVTFSLLLWLVLLLTLTNGAAVPLRWAGARDRALRLVPMASRVRRLDGR
ncbi:MAG: hypothetical protein ACT4P7_09945 [Gemmatimonadaceae bacterium]